MTEQLNRLWPGLIVNDDDSMFWINPAADVDFDLADWLSDLEEAQQTGKQEDWMKLFGSYMESTGSLFPGFDAKGWLKRIQRDFHSKAAQVLRQVSVYAPSRSRSEQLVRAAERYEAIR